MKRLARLLVARLAFFTAPLVSAAAPLAFAFAVASCSGEPTANAQTLTVKAGDKIVFFGTSITAFGWFNGYVSYLNAAYTVAPTTITNTTASFTNRATSATTSARLAGFNGAPIVVNKGVVGNTIADMQARVAADVIAQNPTIVVVEGDVNDLIGATGIPNYTTRVNALLATIHSGLPLARIAWTGILCYGESYPDTVWGATVDSYNAVNAAAVAAVGGVYWDVRTPQQAYESVHNTPPPGALFGIVADDLVHPNDSVGKPLMSNVAIAGSTLTQTP